ncbi:ribulose bisphosphate carboxylase small subunit, chloroplastic-like [Silene latifolia]|uniref:ribulose bisphosphate carboxylase small subunit, chloroplastic-like n=1 Tax=Silene latifolia TaxID=37657 RepID=UPI003D783419
MASLMSNAAVATASSAAQANMVAPFSGLKSTSAFPVSKKSNVDITSLASNGGRVNCMQVWPPRNLKKFETLSYLPPLKEEELLKEINYLLVKGWVPCIEFEVGTAFVYRENNKSPGYYDGRYWTMWKLPMFGCTDAAQVAAEVVECKNAYPDAHIRIIGFDNKRQVQCISFIAYKPE